MDPDAQLSWSGDANVVAYDVYIGADEQAVAGGTGDTLQGRQEATTFDPGLLDPLATYYWRVDAINASGETQAGSVWSFATVDFIVVDDFEPYTNEVGRRVFETWIDGYAGPPQPGQPGNDTGAAVGHDIWSPGTTYTYLMETANAHTGQAMPLYYDNGPPPYHSEAYRFWWVPQDWAIRGMNTLSLWFRGDAANSAEPLYVVLRDDENWSGVVCHPDPNALLTTEWRQWQIRLTTFSFGPADPTAVRQLYIGVGNRQDPQPGDEGIVYIDDIMLIHSTATADPNEG